MFYCKLKMYSWKLKMIHWQLKTMENELRSTRPYLVPLLATTCLYQGAHLKSKDGLLQTEDILFKTKDSVLKTEDNGKWPQDNQTQLIPLLATRCLYWGGRGTSEHRSARHTFVPVLATRCLYWGCTSDLRSTVHILVPGGISDHRLAWPKGWPNVKLTWHSTTLGHQMPLLGVQLSSGQPDITLYQSWPLDSSLGGGGTSELRWTGHNLAPLLATRCLNGDRGYIWPKVSLTQRMTECQADLT